VIYKLGYGYFSTESEAIDAWNLRADLAPAIGYSREQMEDALRHFIGPFRSIDIEYYMNSLTPAAQPRDSKVLVEALEYYGKQRRYGEDGGLAREALAEWKGGLNE